MEVEKPAVAGCEFKGKHQLFILTTIRIESIRRAKVKSHCVVSKKMSN